MALRTAVSPAAAAMAYVSISEYHGQYPCESTTPRFESGRGCKTPPSAFTRPRPCRGFVTDVPCTSWSYCCAIKAVLAIFGRDRSSRRDLATSLARAFGAGSSYVRFTSVLFCASIGRPSCRNAMAISITIFPPKRTMHDGFFVNVPMCVASPPRLSKRYLSSDHFAFGTASVMRSCDSDIHICHGERPGYLTGTFSRSTEQPPHSFAISSTAHESPPAPLSVMLV